MHQLFYRWALIFVFMKNKNATALAQQRIIIALPGLFVVLAAVVFFFGGCKREGKSASLIGPPPALDYGKIPLDVRPVYGQNFSLSGEGGYKVLRAWNFWKGAADTLTYVLYPRGQTPPAGYSGATMVPMPLRKVVCLSTTQVAMLSFLDADTLICGVAGADYIFDEKVRRRIDLGLVAEVGDGPKLNLERIAALQPDLVLAFGMGDAGDVGPRLAKLGIPVALTAEYLEATPLGRAEWVRFMGAFVDKDSLALSRYLAVASEYESLLKLNEARENRPTVMVGAPDRGTWYVPGGKSFVAQLVQDAGGRYLWADNEERGSLALGFEGVFSRAQDADIWLDVVFADNLGALAANDRRVRNFKAFQNEDVYNYVLRRSPGGGYDIFESGVVNPHLVLKDFIKMFMPEEFPDHQFVYYKRLTTEGQVK